MLFVPLTVDSAPGQPPADRLAFKAYEIEELADVYFFRPAGMVFALAAQRFRITPTGVTAASMAVGVAGGALLYSASWSLAGFALIIFYSVLDSSDGQLARMTGQTSEFGRVLDGIGGYVVYAAIYVALIAGPGAGVPPFLIAAAIVSNIAQAQMYDFYRTAYITVAIDGRPPADTPAAPGTPWVAALLRGYLTAQRALIGRHAAVEAQLTRRAEQGVVRTADRDRYRTHFYRSVRGWNLLGDNTRFYAIGALAWLGRLDWWFFFLVVPMNIAFAVLWLWQARADRRFLASL
jgi:phosphatidylglycerophosphate synthase